MNDQTCPACGEQFTDRGGLEAHCYFQHRGAEPEELEG